MTLDIFNAYVADGWHIFELYKTTDGNGNAVKGKYATPKGWNDTSITYGYRENAVYAGMPPKDIIVIDWDVKKDKQGAGSYEALQEMLGKQLDTVVSTPSGGGHTYVRLQTPLHVRKKQDDFPDIDFQCHGTEFVVLGGQMIEGYGEYKFLDEDFEYFVNADVDMSNLQLRNERREQELDDLDLALLEKDKPSEARVREILNKLNPDMGHDDGWQNTIMALNSWDRGGTLGLSLAIEWSQRAKNYNATAEEITQKYYDCHADEPKYFTRLFTLETTANENLSFEERVNTCSTEDGLKRIVKEAQNNSSYNEDERERLGELIATKRKDLGLDKRKSSVHWKKEVQYVDPEKKNEGIDFPDTYWDSEKGHRVYLNTLDNLLHFLNNNSSLDLQYDVILKRVIINGNYKANIGANEIAISTLESEIARFGRLPKAITNHYNAVIFSKQVNPLLSHIESLPEWDGETDYIMQVSKCLQSNISSETYKYGVFKAFVIQAIAAWDNRERTPHKLSKLESVLTLVGGQGKGKTTFVGELMPNFMHNYFKDGVELDPSNKDSYSEAVSSGLVELGELDATTKKSDISSLKAFLSRVEDEYRVPYGRSSERYPRQTVFTGTVNNRDFLKDATGSRRFLVVDVEDLVLPDREIVEGMWAQALQLYLRGDSWLLDKDLLAERDNINDHFTDIGDIGELAEQIHEAVLKSEAPKVRIGISRLVKDITNEKINNRERSDFNSAMSKLGYNTDNKNRLYLPKDIVQIFKAMQLADEFEEIIDEEEF